MKPRRAAQLAVVIAAAALAGGEVRAEVVKADGYYYEDKSKYCPATAIFCQLDFTQLGKRAVMFSRAACRIRTNRLINFISFSSREPGDLFSNVVPLAYPAAIFYENYRYTSFNQEVFLRGPGESTPRLYVSFVGPVGEQETYLVCTITGTPIAN